MNTREEFKKWYDSEFDDGPHYEPTEKAWQTCQALNDKRIAELEEKLRVAKEAFSEIIENDDSAYYVCEKIATEALKTIEG